MAQHSVGAMLPMVGSLPSRALGMMVFIGQHQGQPADGRSGHRTLQAVHPSLQLPALLGAVFLKSSRPSLLIKRAALGNLKTSFHCTHWHRFFPLKKAPPLISVFSPQGRRGKPPSGAQNRYALRLAGHQSPRHGCAGWDRWAVMGISLQLYC